MTIRSEIRAALEVLPKGVRGLSADELFQACKSADGEAGFRSGLSSLKGEGKIVLAGTTDEDRPKALYALGNWSESEGSVVLPKDRPDVVITAKKERKPKPERAPKKKPRGEASPPEPAPRPEDGGAQFAIGESGELGIEKDETKLKLDAGEFARLRKFIDKTSEVWT